jgi:hypothetical protein
MKLGEWITAWTAIMDKTRFDAEDLYKMFIIKTHEDQAEGLTPLQSSWECLEIIEDFIRRYGEVKKC